VEKYWRAGARAKFWHRMEKRWCAGAWKNIGVRVHAINFGATRKNADVRVHALNFGAMQKKVGVQVHMLNLALCGVHTHNKVRAMCTHIIMARVVCTILVEHKGILLVRAQCGYKLSRDS
jgi:hypothetical protein